MDIEWVEIEDHEYPATRGEKVRDERVVDGLRVLHPSRSKLGAILVKGRDLPLYRDTKVLYLGGAAGTTASYFADVCGVVYCVEFASRPAQKLVEIAEGRENLMPIVEDARKPERYVPLVEKVDMIYQDVATRGQAEVGLKNSVFMDSGTLCMCVKARSEDITADPEKVYEDTARKLEPEYEVEEIIDLNPFYSDHAAVIASK